MAITKGPDNDDVTAVPIAPTVLDATDAGLDDPEVQAKLGVEGTALLKRVIAEMRDRQAVADLIEVDSDGLPREVEGSSDLSPEQVAFMGTLRARYEENEHHLACHDAVAWSKVEAKLSANPVKLDALKRMDDSGGAPDVTGVEGEDFIFDELAAKLPDSRRRVTYAQAVARAEAMGGGVKLTRPERYEVLGIDMGIEMDTENDWVWLDSENPNPKYGGLVFGSALFGDHYYGGARVEPQDAESYDDDGAFRCSLRV
ncbi:MAG: DUF4256 domain-containing protein [Candidatus Gracilibacteria bacterium]|jgi:hypothetical protein